MGDSELDRRLLDSLFGAGGVEDEYGNRRISEPRAPAQKSYKVLDPNRQTKQSSSQTREAYDDNDDDDDDDDDEEEEDDQYLKSESARNAARGASRVIRGRKALSSPTSASVPRHDESSAKMTVPQLMTLPEHGGHQTGPKGVLADFQWQQYINMDLLDDRMPRPVQPGLSFHRLYSLNYVDADSRDDAPRQAYRTYREVLQDHFISEVESVHKETAVIVHLFDKALSACRVLDRHLAMLSRKYCFAKFFCMDVSQNESVKIDRVALPALQLYRAGELCVSSMRVTDNIANGRLPAAWDDDDVETFLLNIGFLTEDDEEHVASGGDRKCLDFSSED